ncbi:MAG: hypothetical protein ACREDZ_05555, partial [Kiloniellales bacterium]
MMPGANIVRENRPRARRPGGTALVPGQERYRVAGGSALALRLAAGDRLRVVDLEGGQWCELVAFGPDGRGDPAIIGAVANGRAEGLRQTLAREGSMGRLAASLARHSLSLERARSTALFGPDSRAGEEADFVATAPGLLLAGAPGDEMRVDEQNPPTDLELFVERLSPAANAVPGLPD